MAEKTTPFVINDRRKFTSEGEIRPDFDPSSRHSEPVSTLAPMSGTAPVSASQQTIDPIAFPSPANVEADHLAAESSPDADEQPLDAEDDQMPPAPTAEQVEQATRAYDATVDRLDTALRATNPGMERVPEMSFERFVQSLYMQAILQLGGAAEQGQTPQVDILGARQTIDMLSIMAEKTNGNLSSQEDKLLQSALFEARMGFLEVTQVLARQATARQQPGTSVGGPSIVR